MNNMNFDKAINAAIKLYDKYDMTPEQLHAGIAILWDALGITTAQERDVFSLAAERIRYLENNYL